MYLGHGHKKGHKRYATSMKYPCYADKELLCYDDCTRVQHCKRRRTQVPRLREEAKESTDLTPLDYSEFIKDLELVYEFGVMFLELLADVSKKSGTYHTVGANRYHTKYLITSNVNSSKFYAGGTDVQELLDELSQEYSWSRETLEDALRSAVKAYKGTESAKRS